jgi:hypothetical protein
MTFGHSYELTGKKISVSLDIYRIRQTAFFDLFMLSQLQVCPTRKHTGTFYFMYAVYGRLKCKTVTGLW